MSQSSTVLLVGCGKMGEAMMRGWLDQGRSKRSLYIVEQDADRADALYSETSLGIFTNATDALAAIPSGPDIVVFAVKPQVMDDVLPLYRSVARRALFLSIAAGKTTQYFQDKLGIEARIIRAMPNTPAAVGAGMTVCVPTENVDKASMTRAEALLTAIGKVAWVADEGLMDAVTAVSGSGPAYVFFLTEALAEAGRKQGLPEDLARNIARETVIGAGRLLDAQTLDVATLRQNVTSPGGTTEAALKILMGDDGLQPLMEEAVLAAIEQSRKLAS